MDIVTERTAPAPWAEGDNIPWNEPGFSQRMLREHLSQAHDHASRRFSKIDRQVAWIHRVILGAKGARILDLGCGPGLYASRLARLGHSCVGIDFAPASIRYAKEEAAREGLDCRYILGDLRTTPYGDSEFELVMFLYGEFNVFRPSDARCILSKAYAALRPGGRLLVEPHPYEVIRRMGEEPRSWYASQEGFFSAQPHLVLMESSWDAEGEAATKRHWAVDCATGEVTRCAASYQAYREAGYAQLFREGGFHIEAIYPSLLGEPDPEQRDFLAIVAARE